MVPRSKRRTVLRAEVIRRNHNIGKAEGHAEFLDVGLQLVVGALDGGIRARLLQLNECQRHAVDVADHIEATFPIEVRNGDLVERQVVILVRLRGQEVDGRVLDVALVVDVLDTAVAFHKNLVNAPVLRNRGLRLRRDDLTDGLVKVLLRHIWVEVAHGIAQSPAQHDVIPGVALAGARRKVRAVAGLPFQFSQVVLNNEFEGFFAQHELLLGGCKGRGA